uniref:Uncharacterized protein n=1 Tax=Physcomitrium patens TaxID=3218 RepID=A9RV47_PHYPA|nr:hypothetical protein PHYPA_002703 [Physcomitrium patens]
MGMNWPLSSSKTFKLSDFALLSRDLKGVELTLEQRDREDEGEFESEKKARLQKMELVVKAAGPPPPLQMTPKPPHTRSSDTSINALHLLHPLVDPFHARNICSVFSEALHHSPQHADSQEIMCGINHVLFPRGSKHVLL